MARFLGSSRSVLVDEVYADSVSYAVSLTVASIAIFDWLHSPTSADVLLNNLGYAQPGRNTRLSGRAQRISRAHLFVHRWCGTWAVEWRW